VQRTDRLGWLCADGPCDDSWGDMLHPASIQARFCAFSVRNYPECCRDGGLRAQGKGRQADTPGCRISRNTQAHPLRKLPVRLPHGVREDAGRKAWGAQGRSLLPLVAGGMRSTVIQHRQRPVGIQPSCCYVCYFAFPTSMLIGRYGGRRRACRRSPAAMSSVDC
jgi:hypothetical protein